MEKLMWYTSKVTKKNKTIFLAILLFIMITLPVLAQNGDRYDLSWHTIDNGGGESSGGNYALAGTIGQLEAGGFMSGDKYTLAGGFWGAGVPATEPPIDGVHGVYLPLVVK